MQSPDRQQLLNLLAEKDKELAEKDVKIPEMGVKSVQDARLIAEFKESTKTNSGLLISTNHTTHPDCHLIW